MIIEVLNVNTPLANTHPVEVLLEEFLVEGDAAGIFCHMLGHQMRITPDHFNTLSSAHLLNHM